MNEIENAPPAVEKGRGTLWLVWLIPFVALLMAGWMIYKYYAEQGVDIVVTYNTGNGIEVGKTPLLYKGIRIGLVSDVEVDHRDISKINVTITVDRRAIEAVGRKGNTFVKVSPRVTLTEISGLDTIISGVYIEAYPAVNDRKKLLTLPRQYRFTGTEVQPVQYNQKGVYVTLDAPDGALTEGTPVLFDKFIVGKVLKKVLDKKGVHYIAHIEEKYAWLVREKSRFWKLNALEIKASLAEVKVSFDSLASLLTGGIAFDSPSDSPSVSKKMITRKLYEDRADMRLEDEIVVLKTHRSSSLVAGLSKVYYRGHEAGQVVRVDFRPQSDETEIHVRLEKKFHPLANESAYFWSVRPEMTFRGIRGLDAITRGTYIAFDTDRKDAPVKKAFTLHETPKPVSGHKIRLTVKEAGGIRSGTPIYYRNIEVGTIQEVHLRPKSPLLDVDAVIRKRYLGFLNDTSMFYNRSGIEAEFSLSNVHIDAGPLESVVSGGIAFETLRFDAPLTKTNFPLYKNYKTYKKFRYLDGEGRKIKLRVSELGSLGEGDPVLYKKIKAGEIMDVKYLEADDAFELTLFIAAPYSRKINSSTRFTEASGIDLEVAFPEVTLKAGSLETIVRGGLSFETPDPSAAKDEGVFGLYDAVAAKYRHFTLYMEEGYGLRKGSALLYKQLPVGKVASVELGDGRVEADVLIEKRYGKLLDADTWFWVEAFEAGIDGVKNVSAAISGPAIALRPGMSGKTASSFALRKAPPPPTYGKAGLRVVLIADRRSSLDVGSPVLYRQVKIGQVESWTLLGDGTGVEIVAFIEPKYIHLVRANAKFYNATAFGMDVSLTGVKVKTETLETMLSGGISMAVPEPPGAVAKEGTRFLLYNEPEKEWPQWKPKL